jgi:hypothetical protein
MSPGLFFVYKFPTFAPILQMLLDAKKNRDVNYYN